MRNTPDVFFFEADARRPEELLRRPEVQEILGGKRNVAIVYWGIALFITDEDLHHAAQSLYDWAGQDSCWAFNSQGAGLNKTHSAGVRITEIYKNMGTPVYVRTMEEYADLVRPWKADANGFIPLLEWHGIDRSEMNETDSDMFGSAGAGYGSYLVK